MHEVKVYDNSGKLKKIISINALKIRSKQQLETPAIFKRNKKGASHGQNLLKVRPKRESHKLKK